MTEIVRPAAVISALHWLMNNSDLYKESGIVIDKGRLENLNLSSSNSLEELLRVHLQVQSLARVELQPKSKMVMNLTISVKLISKKKNVGNTDTLLDDPETFSDKTYTLAPGEGQRPLSLYRDPDAEYLAFQTIFCGKRRVSNKDREADVHYSDVVIQSQQCAKHFL